MSFWSRNHYRRVSGLALLAASGAAGAQQIYFQPQVQVGAEGDTNRDLITSGNTFDQNLKRSAAGYNVLANGILGIATPTTDSLIKPEIDYSDFPSLHSDDLRTSLDLNSKINSARGQGSIQGRFDREATYTAELVNPEINEITPGLPNTSETGRISTDTIRTMYTLVPTYTFDLTQRLNWQVTGTYQEASYSGSNAANYVPFQYVLGGTSLLWIFDQRLTGSFGVTSSYEASRNQIGQVNADGANLGLDYKLSTQFTTHLEVTVERDDSQLKAPAPRMGLDRTLTTGIGATYNLTWVGQIQKVQLNIGRTFTPSSNGGTFSANQVQVQYQRDLGPRMQFIGAAVYVDEKSVSPVFQDDDYNQGSATASLKWKMTPTWYVMGGLEYFRESFASSFGRASNGVIYVSVGYQGLGRRT